MEKKRAYWDRTLNVEKGSFTPLVFTTIGGTGPECLRFSKQLAELISMKTGEVYSDVLRQIHTRLRHALLRAILIAVRGTRGHKSMSAGLEVEDISFKLMPGMEVY